jgi:tripartite-type tricarboxylate transporter receptor subunit TctC
MDLLPGIKTLAEQGVNAPMVFNIVISHKDMSVERRNRIRSIFDRAAENIGSQNFMQLSGLRPTQFDNINPEDFYNRSINLFETLLTRYEKAINESKN